MGSSALHTRAMANRFEREDMQLEEEVDAYNTESDRFARENNMLVYFLRKHGAGEKLAEIESVELTSSELHEAAAHVMEDLAEDMETTKAQTQKIVEEMKALMELNDALVSERKKEVFEFSRDAVVGAENPRAGGKRMAEKVLLHFEKKLTQKEAHIKKLNTKNSSLQMAIRKMELQLKNKEQMGEVLNVIDFDQLKIENKQFLEKIEERNNELITLKLTTGNTVQVLNTLKKRLHKLTSESEWLQSEIVQRRDLLIKVEDDIARVIDDANALQRANQRAHRDQQTSDMPHVIDYVKQKLELDTLSRNVENWGQKLRITKGELRRQNRILGRAEEDQ